MKRIGGFRRKTRSLFRKDKRNKGKISLGSYFQIFNIGDRVNLTVEPSIRKGMYHPRFVGKAGIIKGKAGRCYEILIQDIKKKKTLIVHPVHLRRA